MPASIPPDTPADVSLFLEDGKYVFRVAESKSVYVYDRDTAGVSTCTEECAKVWPAVIASRNSKPVGSWTLIERADHTEQWCYRNRPIYTKASDKPGEASGDGADGVWHVVQP